MTTDIIRRQLTLMGSWTFSKSGHEECAQFVADRKLPVESLFSHRFKLEDAEELIEFLTRARPARASCFPITNPQVRWCLAGQFSNGRVTRPGRPC